MKESKGRIRLVDYIIPFARNRNSWKKTVFGLRCMAF